MAQVTTAQINTPIVNAAGTTFSLQMQNVTIIDVLSTQVDFKQLNVTGIQTLNITTLNITGNYIGQSSSAITIGGSIGATSITLSGLMKSSGISTTNITCTNITTSLLSSFSITCATLNITSSASIGIINCTTINITQNIVGQSSSSITVGGAVGVGSITMFGLMCSGNISTANITCTDITVATLGNISVLNVTTIMLIQNLIGSTSSNVTIGGSLFCTNITTSNITCANLTVTSLFVTNFTTATVNVTTLNAITINSSGDYIGTSTSDITIGGYLTCNSFLASSVVTITNQVTTYTLANTTDTLFIDCTVVTTNNLNITLPSAVNITGKTLRLVRKDTTLTSLVTIYPVASQTVGGSATKHMSTANEVWELQSDGTNWQSLRHQAKTEWANAGVLVIGATTTAPSKGITTNDQQYWMRDGKNMFVNFLYVQLNNTGSAVGSGDYVFSIANADSLSVDMTSQVIATAPVGPGNGFYNAKGSCFGRSYVSSTNLNGWYDLMCYSPTQFRMTGWVANNAGNQLVYVSAVGLSRIALNDTPCYAGQYQVPITNWDA